MERTKKVVAADDGRVQWRNSGGGTLVLKDKRVIKPGDVFLAFPNEISMSFRDVIKPLTPIKDEPIPEGIKLVFTLKARAAGGWYDVIDQNGKVKNEKAMKKVDAEALIKSLEG